MKISAECIPCLLSRVLYEVDLSELDEDMKHKALSISLEELNKYFKKDKPTYEISTEVHRSVYDIFDTNDPYSRKKKLGNNIARSILPKIKNMVEEANDPLKMSILASIVSNSLDFGVKGHQIEDKNLSKKLVNEIKKGELEIDDVTCIKNTLEKSKKIGYILDNCGEVIFDSIVLDQIKKIANTTILLFVRGEPIFNDVTYSDVREMEIKEKVDEVIPIGERSVGVHPKYMHADAKKSLVSCDFIISKGMANYESLSEQSYPKVAYVLKAKCEPVANSLNVKKGDNVALFSEN